MENPRSRSRSPPRYNFRFVQPSDEHLNKFLPAAEPRPQVRWLVDQGPEWKGFYRDAQYFGGHLEEMYQKEVEIADGKLVFKDGWGALVQAQDDQGESCDDSNQIQRPRSNRDYV